MQEWALEAELKHSAEGGGTPARSIHCSNVQAKFTFFSNLGVTKFSFVSGKEGVCAGLLIVHSSKNRSIRSLILPYGRPAVCMAVCECAKCVSSNGKYIHLNSTF